MTIKAHVNSSSHVVSLPLRRRVQWIVGGLLVVLLLLFAAGAMVARHVQPMVRARLLQTFQERFHSAASIADLQVHYDGQIQVDGRGLSVQSVLNGVPGDPAHPMLRVQEFHFHLGLVAALSRSPRIHHVRIRGVQLELPNVPSAPQGDLPAPEHEVNLEYAEVDDAHVRFAAGAADRAPLQFDLPHLVFRGVSRSVPIRFHAVVDNGPPIGISETDGTIGPWNFEDPRLVPLHGTFTFQNKDISSVPGLRGHFTLNGSFEGTVGSMHAQGSTQNPDFALDVSSHPVDLRTRFAITLQPTQSTIAIERIEGSFGKTAFVCRGLAIKDQVAKSFRLDVQLDVPAARVEDGLALAASTSPPVMSGALSLNGRLQMRAGPESVSRKLTLSGSDFAVSGASFNYPDMQRTVDELVERAQGDPQNATASRASHATTSVRGTVSLQNALLRFPAVQVTAPGTQGSMHGTYRLDGSGYAFDGTVRTEARLSNMTKGVKHVLLKPFDHMLGHSDEGGGTGATLPIHIHGAGGVVHVDTSIAGLRVKAPGTD